MKAAREWTLAVRDIASLLVGERDVPRRLTLAYDLPRWYADKGATSLSALKGQVSYEFGADVDAIRLAVDSIQRLYGQQRWASRLMEATPIEKVWRRCVPEA